MPVRCNSLHLETRWGIREFELWQGDITALPGPIGLAVVSAFPHDYSKTASSVIGRLWYAHHIDVEVLARDPQLDLRGSLGAWISKPLDDSVPFRRIACLEFPPGTSLRENYENLFAIIAAFEIKWGKHIPLESIVLPMLGAGDQGNAPDLVMSTLLDVVTDNLETLRTVRRIAFVVYQADRASALSEAMDRKLQRIRLLIPRGDIAVTVRARLRELVDKLAAHEPHTLLARDLAAFFDDNALSHQLGVLGRRVAEAMVRDLLGGEPPKGSNLLDNIERLRRSTAEWIRSYLHLLRVFGNESAHEKSTDSMPRDPPTLEERDLVVFMICLQRILEYWTERLPRSGPGAVTHPFGTS